MAAINFAMEFPQFFLRRTFRYAMIEPAYACSTAGRLCTTWYIVDFKAIIRCIEIE